MPGHLCPGVHRKSLQVGGLSFKTAQDSLSTKASELAKFWRVSLGFAHDLKICPYPSGQIRFVRLHKEVYRDTAQQVLCI